MATESCSREASESSASQNHQEDLPILADIDRRDKKHMGLMLDLMISEGVESHPQHDLPVGTSPGYPTSADSCDSSRIMAGSEGRGWERRHSGQRRNPSSEARGWRQGEAGHRRNSSVEAQGWRQGEAGHRRNPSSELLEDLELRVLEGRLRLAQAQREVAALHCQRFTQMLEASLEETSERRSNLSNLNSGGEGSATSAGDSTSEATHLRLPPTPGARSTSVPDSTCLSPLQAEHQAYYSEKLSQPRRRAVRNMNKMLKPTRTQHLEGLFMHGGHPLLEDTTRKLWKTW